MLRARGACPDSESAFHLAGTSTLLRMFPTGARTLAFPRITSYASSTEQRPEWGLEATMISLMKVPDFDPL